MEHSLRIMGRSGDTKVTWDPRNQEEVRTARETFDALRAKGYLAFTVRRTDSRGEQVKEFDPALSEILLAPPMAGGA